MLSHKKIAIVGCAGSGKTTLAQHLASRLSMPVFHLDHYYWKPGFIEEDPAVFMSKHTSFIEQSSWIIDGNQMLTVATRLAAADVIIFIDLPVYVCLWRVMKRWIKSCYTQSSSYRPLRFGFIRYVLRYNRAYKPYILTLLQHESQKPGKSIITIPRCMSLAEIDRIIDSV